MSFELKFKALFREENEFPEPLFLKKSKQQVNNSSIKRRKSFTDKIFKSTGGGTLKLSSINASKLKDIFSKDKINKDLNQIRKIDVYDYNSNLRPEVENIFSSPNSLPPNVECLPLSQSADSYIPVSSSSSLISLPNYKPLKSPGQNKFRTFKRNDPYFSPYGTILKEKLNRSRISSWELNSQCSEVESLYCSSPLSHTLPITYFMNSSVSPLNNDSTRKESKPEVNYYGQISRTDSMIRTNYSSRISPIYGKTLHSNLSKLKFASENCLSKETPISKIESSVSSDSFSSDSSLHMSLDHVYTTVEPKNNFVLNGVHKELQMKLTNLKDKTPISANNENKLEKVIKIDCGKTFSINGSKIPILKDSKVDNKELQLNCHKKLERSTATRDGDHSKKTSFSYCKNRTNNLVRLGSVNESSYKNKDTEKSPIKSSLSFQTSINNESLAEEIKWASHSNDSSIVNDFHKELQLKCAKFKNKMNYSFNSGNAKTEIQSLPNHNLSKRNNTSISSLNKPMFLKPNISPKPAILPKPDSRLNQSFSNRKLDIKELSRFRTLERPKDITNKPEKPLKPRHLSETSGSFQINKPVQEINNNYIVINNQKLEEQIKVSTNLVDKSQNYQSTLKNVSLSNGNKISNNFTQRCNTNEKIPPNHSSMTNLCKFQKTGFKGTLKVKDLVASFNKVMLNENLTEKNNNLAYIPKHCYTIPQKSLSEFNLLCPSRRNP